MVLFVWELIEYMVTSGRLYGYDAIVNTCEDSQAAFVPRGFLIKGEVHKP